jgi:hypothetical protein
MATQYRTYLVLQTSYINGALYQPGDIVRIERKPGDVVRIEQTDPLAPGNLEEIINAPPLEHTAAQKAAADADAAIREAAVANRVEIQAKIDAKLAAQAEARRAALLHAHINAEQRARDFGYGT